MSLFFETSGKQLSLLIILLFGLSNCSLENNKKATVTSTEVIEAPSTEVEEIPSVDENKKQYPTINNIPSAETLRTDKVELYFKTGQQTVILDSTQTAYINNLRAYLAENQEAKIIITGHTDNRGDERMNMRLSRKRAEFVGNYLTTQGFSIHQIITKGAGPNIPLASNDTADGRMLNRRIEITLE